jgi:predicted nuclease of restriction endonuclease-like RecB superfamily
MYCYTLNNIAFLKLEYEIDLCYFHIELFIGDFLINQIEIILVESEGFWR